MNNDTSKEATSVAATGSAKEKPKYYTEGVIKDLWLESKDDTRFTLTPNSEYSIEAEYKGEKKTCAVFRSEGFEKLIFDKGVADLYAGDFIFSAPKGMTFDQLLLIKINRCHVRICVESQKFQALREGASDLNTKTPVQLSEISLK